MCQEFHLGSYEGNLKVIYGSFMRTLWWWKVANSQKWLLGMKECLKYFSSKSWKLCLSMKYDKKRWNFDLGGGGDLIFDFEFFKQIRDFFRFWDFVSSKFSRFFVVEIFRFQICFSKFRDFSHFLIFQKFRIF